MKLRTRVGVLALSSVVPQVELKRGVARLERAGFDVKVHAGVKKQSRFFAGDDRTRAQALLDYVQDPKIDVIWCARGGYGSARLLEMLRAHAVTPSHAKCFVGLSDVTALFGFIRSQWGMSVLHGSMPATEAFLSQKPREWESLCAWARGERGEQSWSTFKLKAESPAPRRAAQGVLVGGNLTLIQSLLGTPDAPDYRGKVVFLEEVDEPLYRIDRTLNHLARAGVWQGVAGVVLGTFDRCRDPVLKSGRKPVRRALSVPGAIHKIVAELGECYDFPVFSGLPVGHGPRQHALPIGAQVRVSEQGRFEIEQWAGWV